jgi:hypothetical protein
MAFVTLFADMLHSFVQSISDFVWGNMIYDLKPVLGLVLISFLLKGYRFITNSSPS